jgi:hypothetical protein
MTRAKITKREGYKCAPKGAIVETFAFGEIVTGQVAEWALADRAASAMFDPREETKVEAPAETKAAPKKRGRPKKADS